MLDERNCLNLLAIETATEACSAAILTDTLLVEQYTLAPQKHNQLILQMIEEVLEQANLRIEQIDGVAFGCGPGSFTGVRIATSIAQGIGYGAELPVIPVSTLAALSLDAFEEQETEWVYSCLDARMGEVYWGVYYKNGSTIQLVGKEVVSSAEEVSFPEESYGVGIGSGWKVYQEKLCSHGGSQITSVLLERFPRASRVAQLGAQYFKQGLVLSAEHIEPVYIRNRVVQNALSHT